MELELLALLNEDLKILGLSLPPGVDAKLLSFLDKVLVANETMNLTSITDKAEAVHKHLIDSLSVLLLKDLVAQTAQSPQWVDIGSGAGFPGLVLALAAPSATLHLVESTGKKAHFLNTVSAELGLLKRVKIHNQRAEVLTPFVGPRASAPKSVPRGTRPKPSSIQIQEADEAQDSDEDNVPRGTPTTLRDSADGVFFRGVARLSSLVELGAPFLKVGGLLVAYKGPRAVEELTEASRAMKELKVELVERKDFVLPGVQEARSLVCLRKTALTSKQYPRLTGLAQKEPLL